VAFHVTKKGMMEYWDKKEGNIGIMECWNNNALVKSHKSPFDKLRANGGQVEIINFIPFVVSLSNHRKDFLRDHQ